MTRMKTNGFMPGNVFLEVLEILFHSISFEAFIGCLLNSFACICVFRETSECFPFGLFIANLKDSGAPVASGPLESVVTLQVLHRG
jgi:hypothetical protein